MAAPEPRDGRPEGHRASFRRPRRAGTGDRLMPRSPGPKAMDLARDVMPDRIEDRPVAPSTQRWTFVLTWFMRILAILCIMKGLSAWAVILGIWTPAGQFELRSTGYQATVKIGRAHV